MKEKIKIAILIGGVFLLALGVRLWDLTERAVWFDEAFDYWSAAAPFAQIPLAVLKTAGSPPLYPYLLHFVLSLGQQVWMLRLPSVLFSLLGWVGVVGFSYREWGFKTALVSGAVLAVLPIDVRYAQEAGEYALMTALLTWMVILGMAALENMKWTYWMGATLLGVLALYTHYGAIVVIAGVAVAAWTEILATKKKEVYKLLMAGFWGCVLCLPLLYFFPTQFHTRSVFEPSSSLAALSDLRGWLFSPVETFAFAFTGYPFTRIPASLVYGFVYLLAAGMMWYTWQEKRKTPRRMMAWFWVSFVLYYLLVRLGLYARGGLGFRYAIMFTPFLAWGVGAVVTEGMTILERQLGWERFARSLVAGFVMAVLLGVCMVSLPNRTLSIRTRGVMPWPEQQDLPKAIRFWRQHNGERQPTYVYYGAVPAFRYYYRLFRGKDETQLPGDWITTCFHQQADFCVSNQIYYGRWLRGMAPGEKITSIEETLNGFPRKWWLVFSHIHPGEEEEIMKWVVADYRIQRYQAWEGVKIYFLVRK